MDTGGIEVYGYIYGRILVPEGRRQRSIPRGVFISVTSECSNPLRSSTHNDVGSFETDPPQEWMFQWEVRLGGLPEWRRALGIVWCREGGETHPTVKDPLVAEVRCVTDLIPLESRGRVGGVGTKDEGRTVNRAI